MITSDFGEVVRVVTEGQSVIEEATLQVTIGNTPMFAFMVKGEEVPLYATYKDITGKKVTVECTVADGVDDKGTAHRYYVIADMKVYDMKNTITLSLDEAGTDVVLKYNLAAYAASAQGQSVAVDDALCSFAIAAYNYKTTE